MSTTEPTSKPVPLLDAPDSTFDTDTRAGDGVDKVLCGICRRQFMKYACPTCNLSYCSLMCYRSEAHSQCTEAFYKKSLEEQIRSEPSKTMEEKREMLNMLKRFEEESANVDQEDLLGSESGDEEKSLSKRLENVDLDSADTDLLWSALNEKQREQFMRAMSDPSSELAQELLASEDLGLHSFAPWWEAPPMPDTANQQRDGARPKMMELPESMALTTGSVKHPSLLYNLFAISLAYVCTTRRLQLSPLSAITPGDPDVNIAQDLLLKVVPFLADPKSAIVFESVEEVVMDVWSRVDFSHSEIAQSLVDAVHLLRPSLVTVQNPTLFPSSSSMLESHPRVNAFRMLSDLHTLFGYSSKSKSNVRMGTSQKRVSHIRHKLVFYGAHLVRCPDLAYARMLGAVGDRARLAEDEASKAKLERQGEHEEMVSSTGEALSRGIQPVIEEIIH